jgi:SAM-dependent methyltransferase
VRDDLHPAAAAGFARGAADYEGGRPGYPREAVEWLAERLGLGVGRTVVDLAAGTGKLTRLLALTGGRVIAVEPLAEMRALIGPPAEPLDGTAEAIPLPDGSADAVTVAQAFHWFDAASAIAEIRRILRPAGSLALIWNDRGDEDPLNRSIRELIEPYRAGTPTHRGRPWQGAFEQSDAFGPPEGRSFDNPQRVEADALAERIASISFISALPASERERVLAAIRELAGDGPVTVRQRTYVQVFKVSPC